MLQGIDIKAFFTLVGIIIAFHRTRSTNMLYLELSTISHGHYNERKLKVPRAEARINIFFDKFELLFTYSSRK